VQGMTSLMVAQLVRFQQDFEAAGGRLALCSLCPEVGRMLEWTRLDEVFHIYPTEREAVQGVQA
jgi:anti-anti-sigma factor